MSQLFRRLRLSRGRGKPGLLSLLSQPWGLLGLLLLGLLLSSCASYRRQSLFQSKEHEQYYRQHTQGGYDVLKLKPDSMVKDYDVRYRIKAGDQVQVRYLNLPPSLIGNRRGGQGGGGDQEQSNVGGREISKTYRVNVDGYFKVRFIGKVYAQGKTEQQLAQRIEKAYADIFEDPQVEAFVTSRRVFTFGEIASNGIIQLQREYVHLVEVLAQAGGITNRGKVDKVKIIRGDLDNPQVIWVNMRRVTTLSHPELYVRDEDIIFVETRNLQYFIEQIQPYTSLINIVTLVPSLYLLGRNLSR